MEFGERFWWAVMKPVIIIVLVLLVLCAFSVVVVWSCLRLDMCIT